MANKRKRAKTTPQARWRKKKYAVADKQMKRILRGLGNGK